MEYSPAANSDGVMERMKTMDIRMGNHLKTRMDRYHSFKGDKELLVKLIGRYVCPHKMSHVGFTSQNKTMFRRLTLLLKEIPRVFHSGLRRQDQ